MIEIHNLAQNHLAVIKIGNAKIIQGHKKITQIINISAIAETVQELEASIMTDVDNYRDEIPFLTTILDNLKTNLKQLRPKTIRTKRWDSLGRAWKWMSGSPDADDLRIINRGIDDVVDNNNIQIKINDNIQENLENITLTIRKLASLGKENLHTIERTSNLVSIIVNLNIINEEITTIQNSILLSQLQIVNHKQLQLPQIESINKMLSDQQIFPDSLLEGLGFATSTIGTNGETILYTVNVPILGNTSFDHLKIEPIVSDTHRIKLQGNEYLYGQKNLFLKLGDCKTITNWTICHLSELSNMTDDKCLSKLIIGQDGNCKYESVLNHIAVTEMSSNILLFNNINETMENTCGVTNRRLIGSFLVIYENCTITIARKTFTNQILEVTHQPVFIPTINVKVTKTDIELPTDPISLQQLHKLHLKHLEHINIQSQQQWTLLGGFSLTTVVIILLIIFILFKGKSYSANIKISRPEVNQTKRQTTSQEAIPIRFYIPPSVRDLPSNPEVRF